jgi:hypothetical protein
MKMPGLNEENQLLFDETVNILLKKAVHSGDRFRQWVYPRLPLSYTVNPNLYDAVYGGIATNGTPEDIANLMYKIHA